MSADGIVWEDPPPPMKSGGVPGRSPRNYGPVYVELSQHPKRWARIATFPGRPQAWTQAKKHAGTFGDRFEFAPRAVDGGSALYVRYLGPVEAAS